MHTNTGPTLAAAQAERVGQFAGVFSSQTVEQILGDSYARLLPASIEGFLPLLAARFARERLRAASRALPGRGAARVGAVRVHRQLRALADGRSVARAALSWCGGGRVGRDPRR
ncbi:MAG: hypothetical protein WA966_14580 [Ornithinimicrobium sp.]